jgi:hypothetical protein
MTLALPVISDSECLVLPVVVQLPPPAYGD